MVDRGVHVCGVVAMGIQVATIIVEPRLLVRQALESLMMHHSYRVVCGVGSTADVPDPSILAEGPTLAILGAQSADNAVAEPIEDEIDDLLT